MPKISAAEKETNGIGTDQADSLPVLSVKEAAAEYPGEWVLMKVTEFDEYRIPTHGQVISHWTSYKEGSKELSRLLCRPEYSRGHYYLFSGHYYNSSGADLHRALEDAERQGGAGAWREW